MNSIRLLAVVLLQFYLFSLQGQEIKNRNNFTVVIDPGHGGKDPGAVSNGFYEKIITLNTSLKLGQILQDNGIKVIYTRDRDKFVNLLERANIANKSDAQLFISIHCNYHTSQAYGAETFVLGLHANQRNFEVAKKENSVIFFEDDYESAYAGFDPNNPESVIGLTLMQEEYLDQSIIAASYIQNGFVNRLNRKNRNINIQISTKIHNPQSLSHSHIIFIYTDTVYYTLASTSTSTIIYQYTSTEQTNREPRLVEN